MERETFKKFFPTYFPTFLNKKMLLFRETTASVKKGCFVKSEKTSCEVKRLQFTGDGVRHECSTSFSLGRVYSTTTTASQLQH